MKVALVHDYIQKLGGAERVLKVFSDMFPEAPIFTLLYDEKFAGDVFPKHRIHTSFLQTLPSIVRNRHRYLLPIIPSAVESFNFSGYDLVLSSSGAFSHGILTPVGTKHICYCHSPMRFAWDYAHDYLKEQGIGNLRKALIAYMMKRIRMWEQTAIDRADLYVANSATVQRRLRKYYRVEAPIIYPPVDVDRFKPQGRHEDYFLIVSTLTPYKKIDLAIRLFNKIGRHLIIMGDGGQREYLERISGKNIEFTGFKSDSVVTEYMQNCRALIFPGEDDFGITPIEAMACGKPVLALGSGGATETVIPGKTGEFFSEPNIESMEDALGRLLLHEKTYNPDFIAQHARQFSHRKFETEMLSLIHIQLQYF